MFPRLKHVSLHWKHLCTARKHKLFREKGKKESASKEIQSPQGENFDTLHYFFLL